MTPAIKLLAKAGIPFSLHEYEHDPKNNAYGLEAADKLAVSVEKVFKTLVVRLESEECVIAVVPVPRLLSVKLIAKLAGSKKASLAEPLEAERTTGYVLGGVSPLAQKKKLKTFIDASAQNHNTIYVSGGRRGLEIELSPIDLAKLCDSEFAELCL
ncbi:Cys-tRNA(Pro) deacylase [Alteromonas ponticola]|uniref:Cys-tRNA(Pro)/Cys-tRNA(Cys) deacylase n=1 Tax=Alteromonas aquimaris TaxID=2998417 RepID=A0ABT3PAC8_9ALTE|nr:Cys-tRNA(Pro) deacylase [Alteromonas aquimaris]MCW8109733.1 Cys-tRNA(Pro) deacylase [Alteromonas aquimaris]